MCRWWVVCFRTQADIYYQLAFCVEDVDGESTVTVDTFDTCDQDSLDEDLPVSPKRDVASPAKDAPDAEVVVEAESDKNEYSTPRDDDVTAAEDEKLENKNDGGDDIQDDEPEENKAVVQER